MIPEPNKSVSCPCCQVEILYHDSHEYSVKDEKYLDCPYCGEPIIVNLDVFTLLIKAVFTFGLIASVIYLVWNL